MKKQLLKIEINFMFINYFIKYVISRQKLTTEVYMYVYVFNKYVFLHHIICSQ